MKEIDLSKSVYDLSKEYPDDFIEAMKDAGFKDIATPEGVSTFGRLMTIPKGSRMKNIPMDTILKAFHDHGFTIKDEDVVNETPEDREALLKSMIRELHEGVPMETVQEEFRKHFSTVSAKEIADAEQTLIREGLPAKEVQKLCDVHSVMFHGSVREEKQPLKYSDIPGHPMWVMVEENRRIRQAINAIRETDFTKENAKVLSERLTYLKQIKQHYGKKEELYFPKIEKYGVTGPSTVMWGVDSEIYREISIMAAAVANDDPSYFKDRVLKNLDRAEEMIYKEESILFPIAAENFTDEDWAEVYRDYDEMGYCMIDKKDIPAWTPAVKAADRQMNIDGAVQLSTGALTAKQLDAIFSTLPIDITFIDENDITRFFTNSGNRMFPRPMSALGKLVYKCHSPNIEPIVRQLISDFKSGVKDKQEIWINKPGKLILVRYLAVRDKDGKYVGTLETSVNMMPFRDQCEKSLQFEAEQNKQQK